MDISDALNVVRQMKNHFRAFEKLEELLAFAANLDEAIKEKQGKIKEIADTILNGEHELCRITDEVKRAKEEHAKLLESYKVESVAQDEALKRGHAERMADLETEFKQSYADHTAELTAINTQIAERQELAAGLDRTIQEKRAALDALRSKLRGVLDD